MIVCIMNNQCGCATVNNVSCKLCADCNDTIIQIARRQPAQYIQSRCTHMHAVAHTQKKTPQQSKSSVSVYCALSDQEVKSAFLPQISSPLSPPTHCDQLLWEEWEPGFPYLRPTNSHLRSRCHTCTLKRLLSLYNKQFPKSDFLDVLPLA